MQVKKFEAPTMQEALKVIKRELGPEAIILSTKHIKSGFGLMSKASVEVTAAVAEKDLAKKKHAEKGLPQDVKEKIWNSKADKQAEIYNDYFEKQLKRVQKDKVELKARERDEHIAARQQQARQAAQAQASPAPGQSAQTRPQAQAQQAAPQQANAVRERRYIDITDEDTVDTPRATPAPRQPAMLAIPENEGKSAEKVRNLEADVEQLKSLVVELAAGATSRERDREESEQGLSDEVVKVMQDLVAAGVEKKLARQLIREASFELNGSQNQDEQLVLEAVASVMMREIRVGDLLEGVGAPAGNSSTTVIALVGPTGVGKTTTIAKIASLAILEKRLRVGLINLDSYKVAAADQLSTYAKIMNVPFRSVNNKNELQQALYDFSSLDLVLIDTTGRSQKDQESLLHLRHMLGSIDGLRSVLLTSATTKDSDMNEVVSRFKMFSPAGLVFSKLDETSVYGCIYNVQKRSGLPLLYFTVGQRVPEDIERASAERVVDLILDL
jgi:flagellar biosynthesis protein FlhF